MRAPVLIRPQATVTVLLAATSLCAATKPEWRVGLARVKITPDGPIRLDGYAHRTKASDGVVSDLWAKAMAIEDGRGRQSVLITLDLIGFPSDWAEAVSSAIAAKTGMERRQILLNCSHTHSGPVVALRGFDKWAIDDAEREALGRYNEELRRLVTKLAGDAMAALAPGVISWGTGTVGFVTNRREPSKRGIVIGVNPLGQVDRVVPVLRVDGPEGRLRAIVFGCACHNTTLLEPLHHISGDYAGFAQAHVEGQHPGVQAMFMLGCAGSANPHPRGGIEVVQAHGEALGSEVCRVLDGPLVSVHGPLRAELDWVMIPLAPMPPRARLKQIVESGPDYLQFTARRMLRRLNAGRALLTHYPMPLAVWQFGDDLTLVGISGEAAAEYVPLVQQALGPQRLWIAGYCNDVFGYLVTAQMLREGGYETRGLFHRTGYLAPQAQDTVIEAIRSLTAKMRRRPHG